MDSPLTKVSFTDPSNEKSAVKHAINISSDNPTVESERFPDLKPWYVNPKLVYSINLNIRWFTLR